MANHHAVHDATTSGAVAANHQLTPRLARSTEPLGRATCDEGGQGNDVLNRLAMDRKLSPREHQVFALVVMGLSGKSIACELGCSHATVRTLLARIQRKFDCHSVSELLASVLRELACIVNNLPT